MGDDGALTGALAGRFANISQEALNISRGSVVYVKKSVFENNGIHIQQSRKSRIRTQGNTFGAYSIAAIQQETALCLWNDDTDNPDVFTGATFNTTPVVIAPGGYISRVNTTNAQQLSGHLSYASAPITLSGATRAEPSVNLLSPFRMPGYWLMSPFTLGKVEYEIYTPIAETITLEITGESSSSVLASLILNPSGANRYLVKFEFTGPINGSVGRFVASAIGAGSAIRNNFGQTSGLNQAVSVAASVALKRFRFYVTRSVGTENLEILRMRSEVSI